MVRHAIRDRQDDPNTWMPWSRRRYYLTEVALLAYFLFWLWAWYGIVYKPRLPLIVRILIGIVLVFSNPSHIFFEPYEKAMKRMAKMKAPPRVVQGGAVRGEAQEDRRRDTSDDG